MKTEYPRDYYIELQALRPHYRGRITLNRKNLMFYTEVAIVSLESDKIYEFVGTFYNFEDEKDALDSSIQKLSHFFKKLKS
jgi:hypothetical protein